MKAGDGVGSSKTRGYQNVGKTLFPIKVERLTEIRVSNLRKNESKKQA